MKLSKLFAAATLLPALLIGAMLAHILAGEWQHYRATRDGVQALQLVHQAMLAAEKVSLERGPANALLGGADRPAADAQLRLAQARRASEQALEGLRAAMLAAPRPNAAALRAVAQAGATLVEARRGVDAVVALPRAQRDRARIRAAVQRMFDVVPPAMEAVTLLSQDAEEVYQRFSGALLNARIAAELREAAGRLGSQFTAALTTGAPLGEEENAAIHVLRGRIEQLRLLMTLSLSKSNADPQVAAALRAMQARYFGAGLELADGIVAASGAGRPYGMDSGQFAARYVPAMQAILRVRDALLAQSIEDAGRASARARRALLLACGAGAATLLLLAALLLTLRRRVVQPLLRATRALVDIANGRLERALPVSRRRDEIGAMQRALALLQRGSIEKRQMEQERLRLIEQLKLSADTDHLTGTLNRRAFTAAGKTLARRCHAHGQALSLIVFDIDHFKAVNDTFGHDGGDQVLVHIAQLVRRELCDSDMLARYGGEEFIVMPAGCDLAQARVVAERIRAAIAAAPVALAGAADLRVTASFGVAAAAAGPLAELDGLFRAADQALYRAKKLGRNRVECALTVSAEPG